MEILKKKNSYFSLQFCEMLALSKVRLSRFQMCQLAAESRFVGMRFVPKIEGIYGSNFVMGSRTILF